MRQRRMWWRAATVVLMCVLASAVGTLAPAEVEVAGAVPNPPIPAGVPPLPTIESTSAMGKLNEPTYMFGHDKGQSTYYDNGANPGDPFSYWSFGDTGIDQPGQPRRFLGNTAAATTDLNLGDNISAGSWNYDNEDVAGYPTEAYPKPPDCAATPNCRVWGASTVADPANRRMIGIYHVIGGGLDYYGVATWSELPVGSPDPGDWTVHPISNPTVPANQYRLWENAGTGPNPAFDTGMIIKDGFLYAYGCWKVSDDRPGDCRLARVPTTNVNAVMDRAQWRFYTAAGNGGTCPAGTWSADINCASPLPSGGFNNSGVNTPFEQANTGGMTVSWNAYLGRYLAVYIKFNSHDILYRVADNLEGPWSAPGLIGRAKRSPVVGTGQPPPHRPLGSRPLPYAAYVHPEFGEQNGKVQYITYARTMCADQSNNCPYLEQYINRQQFELVKVEFGNTPARYQRYTNTEAYFGHSSGLLRVNALGPTIVDTSGTGTTNGTDVNDRHGAIFTEGTGQVGTSAVVRLDTQSSNAPVSLAGLIIRNKIGQPHGTVFNEYKGRGYVALVASPGGGVSLRWDQDGDHDLDQKLPATPNSVSAPVWLRLTRVTTNTYQGAYSTNSTNGTDGTWTSVGTTGNVPQPEVRQDVGVFAAGPTEVDTNRAVFSGFEVRPTTLGTWGARVSPVPVNVVPPRHCTVAEGTDGFKGQTIRNIVHTSIGSPAAPATVRVKVSNLHGTRPLKLAGGSVGLPTASGDDLTGVPTRLTFDGGTVPTGAAPKEIPIGTEAFSDPVPVNSTLQDQDLAVSFYFQDCTGMPTWHQKARSPNGNAGGSFVIAGDHAMTVTPPAQPPTPDPHKDSWFFVSAVDVVNPQALGTVVTLGDSLTDGEGTSTSNRWPDKLVDRLAAAGTVRLGVVNKGNPGDRLSDAAARFDVDVLKQSGVRTVIVSLGVNDLIAPGTPPTAAQMIGYYRTLATLARASGIRILIGTITPLGTNAVNVPARETVRQDVNAFLRASSEFDGIIDFDEAVRGTDARYIKTEFEALGQHGTVHCNAAGYNAMANKITLADLFQPPRTR